MKKLIFATLTLALLIGCSSGPSKEERIAQAEYYQHLAEERKIREAAKKNTWIAESKEKCASYDLTGGELNRCVDEKVEKLEEIERERVRAARNGYMQMLRDKKNRASQRKAINCNTQYGDGRATTNCY